MGLNYVMIGTTDAAAVRGFYDGVFTAIGGVLDADFKTYGFSYKFADGTRAWVCPPYNKEAPHPGNGNMPGFGCNNIEQVIAAHAAALANGGSDEGAPGPRPHYGPKFYGAYVRDPSGNKLSFVCEI
jgi:catechol 2,3-dioxygenase-like lactoylglutathione lyase family enzyme